MFTPHPRTGSHLRAAARQAAARPRGFAAALAAVTCARWHQPSSPRPPRPNWSGIRQAVPRWHRSRRLPSRSSPWAACPAGRSP
jgi:hypothetical protein